MVSLAQTRNLFRLLQRAARTMASAAAQPALASEQKAALNAFSHQQNGIQYLVRVVEEGSGYAVKADILHPQTQTTTKKHFDSADQANSAAQVIFARMKSNAPAPLICPNKSR